MQSDRTIGRFAPQQSTFGSVGTAHSRLESPGADHITDPAYPRHQIDQTLDIIGAAGRGDGNIPPGAAVAGVHANQATAQARHQGVTDCQQHASLAQNQGLARALLAPQLST